MRLRIILILTLFSGGLISQEETSVDSTLGLSLMTTYINDQVILRWAYDNYKTWELCRLDTFLVERYDIDERGVPITKSVQFTEVRPFNLEEFQPFVDANNENVIAVGDLMYGAPKSDTNSVYEQYHEARNRFAFAMIFADKSKGAAEALGLRLEDQGVAKNQEYFYRVKSKNHPSIKAGFSSISTYKESQFPLSIDTILEQEMRVVLVWDKEEHNPYYTGYYIERSEDGVNYERLNDSWLLSASSEDYQSTDIRFVDSVENFRPHYYRIVGHTPFNFETQPSRALRAQARDRTPPLPPANLTIRQEADHSVVIEWEFPEPHDVAQCWVEHSLTFDKFYARAHEHNLDAASGQYTDQADPGVETNYYRLVYADQYGNQARSIHLSVVRKDSIPPSTPEDFAGTIDSNGMVHLSWSPSNERDVKGYYLYRTYKADHDPTMITGEAIANEQYVDSVTMETLTEEVVYRITAVDYYGNYSDYSEPLVLERPDLIPPNPAIFKCIELKEEGIMIQWDESNSKDVVHHLLSRRTNDTEWTVVKIFEPGTKEFIDTVLQTGQKYVYRIQAEDDAGWKSEVISDVSMRFNEIGAIPVPNIFRIQEGEKGIEVEWEKLDGPYSYVLAKRKNEGGKYTTIKITTASSFLDPSSNKLDKNISYRVQAVHEDGRRSRWGSGF